MFLGLQEQSAVVRKGAFNSTERRAGVLAYMPRHGASGAWALRFEGTPSTYGSRGAEGAP